MPSAGFEPTILAGERPQTYALDRAATGTGITYITYNIEQNKAIPLQASWTDPQGSRRLRLPDIKTIGIWRW